MYFLGPPRVELDGAEIRVDTRKAIAILAYLSLTGTPQGRDALAAIFWPESDPRHARGALRRTLSVLNRSLDGVGLSVDREAVEFLHGPDVWSDVHRFTSGLAECTAHGHPETAVCPACHPRLQEAADLYRDAFLAGFTLRASPAFDEWQFFQGDDLARRAASALERLVACQVAAANLEAALESARRWLALDPLNESAHRSLMRLYTWTGQRTAALRQYRACVRILEDELGVGPLDETAQLHEAIQHNRLDPPPTSFPPSATGVDTQAVRPLPAEAAPLPLVGRERELGLLQAAHRAAAIDGRWVILEGEAGIGKTRLAGYFVDQARVQGAAILTARCYDGQGHLAYGPFVEALRAGLEHPGTRARLEALEAHHLREASRLLPELAPAAPGLPPSASDDDPGARIRFFEAVRRLVIALLHARSEVPGVLWIDDLHWADEASLGFLIYLVRRLAGARVCVLVTWRPELVPRGHPLRQLAHEQAREGVVELVALARWGPTEIREMVRASGLAPAPDLDRVAERLWQESEGLPYFVGEYLATFEAGRRYEVGQWPVPQGVQALLRARVSRLTETGWQLLSAASVIGRSFDLETLQETSGRNEAEIVAALESLVSQGLILEIPGEGPRSARYDFSHDKLRALAYEETSLARRRLLHRRTAEALLRRARTAQRRSPLASTIAHHFRLGAQDEQAAVFYQMAGEHARALYANTEAQSHYQAAIALGHPDPAAIYEALGDLQTLAGDYDRARESYEAAAAHAGPGGLAEVERKLGTLYDRRGDWDMAVSHYRAAEAGLGDGGPPAARARLYTDWSRTAHRAGRETEAQGRARQALDLAEASGDERGLAPVKNLLGVIARRKGDLEEAGRWLRESLETAERWEDGVARVAARNNLAQVYGELGEYERAIQLTQEALEICSRQGDRHRQAALHNNLADLLHAAGRPEEAMDHLKQAVSIFAEVGGEGRPWEPEIWKLAEW
jgi:DNA-binding SARP family transcriptional activator